MGKKGKQQHLKRLPAPKFWPIHRKEAQWIVKPRPGPHKIHQCIPLILIVRDMLQLVKSRREAKIVLSEGQVKVDRKIRKNDDYPVGLMDVIEIPVINASYRVLPALRKGLILHSITSKESESKLCQIINKTTVTGGHLQLNLHDGRNILCKVEDSKNPEVKAGCRKLLDEMIESEIQNCRELIDLWKKAPIEWMIVSGTEETPFIHADNFVDLLANKVSLMTKHRGDEPSIDPDYMFRIKNNPYI